MELSGHQQQVCWEKVSRVNSFFRLTHPYCPEELSQKVLAVHALYACFDLLVHRASDEEVAQRQLEWWRNETLPENIEVSRHPVVGGLRDTDAFSFFPPGALSRLVEGAARRLESRAPANLEELDYLCRQLYQPRIDIEAALTGGNTIPHAQQQFLAFQGGLILLFRGSISERWVSENKLWWVPLSLLARNGISRSDLARDLNSRAAKKLVTEICTSSESLVSKGMASRNMMFGGAVGHIHLLLNGCVHGRRLERLRQVAPGSWGDELTRFYLGDVFKLWKTAREIRSTSSA